MAIIFCAEAICENHFLDFCALPAGFLPPFLQLFDVAAAAPLPPQQPSPPKPPKCGGAEKRLEKLITRFICNVWAPDLLMNAAQGGDAEQPALPVPVKARKMPLLHATH
jgi:hypothetical protein